MSPSLCIAHKKQVNSWSKIIRGLGGALAIMSALPVLAAPVEVIEYYDKELNHYFMTSQTNEIADLDTLAITQFQSGWNRTGRSFWADNGVWTYDAESIGKFPVCRFYSETIHSHFYLPLAGESADECSNLAFKSFWAFEGVAFYVQKPTQKGVCPDGMEKVYGLYHNDHVDSMTGFSQRHLVDAFDREDMIGKGWQINGRGNDGVAFCTLLPPYSSKQ